MDKLRFYSPVLLIFVLGLIAYGCKNDAPAPAPKAETVVPPPPAKPDLLLMVPWVNAKLRQNPTINGKEIAALTKGLLLTSTGEMTATKDSIVIQQIPMREPWYKVTVSGDSTKNGWVFGGTVLPVWKGHSSDGPDQSILTAFLKTTGTYDLRKPESAGKAIADVRKILANPVNNATADCLFILLRQFMTQMESDESFYLLIEKIPFKENEWTEIWENRFDHNKYPQTKRLAENGFRVTTSEGMAFPMTDLRKLGAIFARKLSAPMQTWLDQTIYEDENPMWEDGGIIIPIEEVADRCVFWGKFNAQNPWFSLAEETQQNERFNTLSVIMGDDNTPAFDYETKTPTPAFRKAWNYVLQKYPDTPLGKKIKEFTDLLAREGDKMTPTVDAWIGKFIRLTNY